MTYHLVQPWGRDTYRQATVLGSHATAKEAYAQLDSIAAKLARDAVPEDYFEIYVVDGQRQPVPRPDAH